MEFNLKKNKYSIIIFDFFLLNISFFLVNYLKRGSLKLPGSYIDLLLLSYLIWFSVSVGVKKFDPAHFRSYVDFIGIISKSIIYYVYFSALIIVLFGLQKYSRLHVFGLWAFLFFCETAAFSIVEFFSRKNLKISLTILICDFILLLSSFFVINYFKRGTIIINPEYEKIVLILIGVWFATSFVTQKFNKFNITQNFFSAYALCIKSCFLMFAIMSVLIFAFRLFYFSRLQIYGSILILAGGELIIFYTFCSLTKGRFTEKDIETLEEVNEILKQEDLPTDNDYNDLCECPEKPLENKLKKSLSDKNEWLCKFILDCIDVSKIRESECHILHTNEPYNIEIIENNSKRLIINLQKINDLRWINRYLLGVHKKLRNGSYIVGRIHTLATNKRHIYAKYPIYLRNILYTADFVTNRIFPILPFIKRIYFYITRGRRRLISRAEMLGRLYFCGYKLIDERVFNRRYYFIAQKAKTASLDKNPSYGPVVKLKRYGVNKKVICTYKFRTMFPYSEYIQEYLYEKNQLEIGGKFKNDFRISTIGKILRKTWLDELPMFYNWIKGDLKLFGVRPLSPHYFNLYDKELQKLRTSVKPGLIPPYYADLPETFDEICQSERRYLKLYSISPLKTQWKYYCKALYNILIKGARSHRLAVENINIKSSHL